MRPLLLWLVGPWLGLAARRELAPSDVSLSRYSETGELPQLRYAARSVSRASPVLAFVGAHQDEAVTVLLRLRRLSPLSDDRDAVRPFETMDDALLFAAGYPPDCRAILVQAAVVTQSHKLVFGGPPPTALLSGELRRWVSRGMRREEKDAVVRPLAAAVVVCDVPRGGPLAVLDCGGGLRRLRFVCLGAVGRAARRALARETPGLSLRDRAGACAATLLEAASASSDAVVDVVVVQHGRGAVTSQRSLRSREEVTGFVAGVLFGEDS